MKIIERKVISPLFKTQEKDFQSQKVSKVVIIYVSKTGCRYLNCSLPNQFPWIIDKPEVLAEVTKRPRFLPWQFDTISVKFWLGNGVVV